MNPIDAFYERQLEPLKSCLLAMRDIILSHHKEIESQWKYGMPFFCFNGKMVCYLWIDKSKKAPYIGIVDGKRITHPLLVAGTRSRMKILMIDPDGDLPVKEIRQILRLALSFHR